LHPEKIERFARPVVDRAGLRVGWLELYYDVTGERQIQSKLLQTEKWRPSGSLFPASLMS
jgi:hypothetical protein